MSFRSADANEESAFVIRAEQALTLLRNRVTAHIDRESRLCRVYGEWQEAWQSRANMLKQQVNDLEARLSPWIPRDEAVRLAVVARPDEMN